MDSITKVAVSASLGQQSLGYIGGCTFIQPNTPKTCEKKKPAADEKTTNDTTTVQQPAAKAVRKPKTSTVGQSVKLPVIDPDNTIKVHIATNAQGLPVPIAPPTALRLRIVYNSNNNINTSSCNSAPRLFYPPTPALEPAPPTPAAVSDAVPAAQPSSPPPSSLPSSSGSFGMNIARKLKRTSHPMFAPFFSISH